MGGAWHAFACAAVLPAAVFQTAAAPSGSVQALKPVVVTATRTDAEAFDVPASIDSIDGEELREGRAQINLSESVGAVPGLLARDRQNYAQDVQISVRGFGARSTFGIRGVRLYADGRGPRRSVKTMGPPAGPASHGASAGAPETMREMRLPHAGLTSKGHPMRFNSKIVAFAAIPAFIFIVGLMVSIGSLVSTRDEFTHYINSEQAVERGLSEMYAQGLQMGQALRNVVMDPANPKALENFKIAQVAYDTAFAQTQGSARGSAFEAALASLPPMRAAQAKAQDKVLALVAAKGEAIPTLNSEETPAWREMRGEILKQREAAAKGSEAARLRVNRNTDAALWLSVGIAVAAAVVAIGLNLLMQRTVRRELGADPENSRAALALIAQGNLMAGIVNAGDERSLMGTMSQMQLSLQKLVQGVRQSANGIATATDEIASGSQDLSNRTESQASALAQTAASMDALGSTVKQNADSARQANQLAIDASTVAVRGGEVVSQVVATMQGINDASRKIADIIGVIDGIAFQTNILALNAAVEAARAGEQGRGFAVVASEVRSLAGRSAEAAKEIKSLIGASVTRVEQGSVLADQAGATMTEVVGSIRRVTDIMGEISASSAEQANGVDQVGQAVTLMDQTTQQNAALVEQMAASASSLNSQASELMQAVELFKLRDGEGGSGRGTGMHLVPALR